MRFIPFVVVLLLASTARADIFPDEKLCDQGQNFACVRMALRLDQNGSDRYSLLTKAMSLVGSEVSPQNLRASAVAAALLHGNSLIKDLLIRLHRRYGP
jgi:hypothetical protein